MDRTSYALVPGAGSDSWYWHRLVPELERLGRSAIAVDLPCDDDAADLPDYAAAVVDQVGDREPLVLVAQSMAGLSVPLICARRRVALIVLVNAMIPAGGETAGGWWANTGQGQARRALDVRQGRDPDAPFDPRVTFFHDLSDELFAASAAHVRNQSDTPFASPRPLPAWPSVPTRVVVGRDDRLFPADFQRRLARERLGLDVDELPGGHLLALAQPAALAQLLERYRSEAQLP